MTACGAATKTTVLLMENKPAARIRVATLLDKAGFNVIAAESTGEAWDTLEARPDVEVLFADLDVCARTEGLELTRKVHDRWPSIGLVITSDQVRHLRPHDIPGDGCFLPRPVPVETLLHEVQAAAR